MDNVIDSLVMGNLGLIICCSDDDYPRFIVGTCVKIELKN